MTNSQNNNLLALNIKDNSVIANSVGNLGDVVDYVDSLFLNREGARNAKG